MIFSPSIDAVFRGSGLAIGEQLATLGALGYRAFEMWGWWDRDLEALQQAKEREGLTLASMCTRFVPIVDPARQEAYIDGLRQSLAVADRLGCRFLISQTGNALSGVPRQRQRDSIVAALRAAVPYVEDAGTTLIVEPLNTRFDHPGYFLERSDEAFAIVDEVDSPCVKVVYDIYHQQISEGNLIPTIRDNIGRIAYFHLADHPGRDEPGTGEIHCGNVLAAIRDTGYAGFIGLEYFPTADPAQSLARVLRAYAAPGQSTETKRL